MYIKIVMPSIVIHTCMHACMHARTHTYTHPYMHACIHTHRNFMVCYYYRLFTSLVLTNTLLLKPWPIVKFADIAMQDGDVPVRCVNVDQKATILPFPLADSFRTRDYQHNNDHQHHHGASWGQIELPTKMLDELWS